ncbi:MAG: hypothetical protein ABL927_14460, partial [Bdellovibrionales bacterium]
YKCGRDFIYYELNYYFPSEFNQNVNNPKQIDRENIFGLSVPTAFSWSMLQFVKMPRLLNKYLLILRINKRKVDSFWNFIVAMIFSRISHDKAINLIENSIDRGNVVGVDIALRFQGLEDHIMFVYGYDEDNLYVFDTNKIPVLEYEKITDDEKFIMKLPRRVIKERWKKFSRVWEISKQN